MISSTQDKLFRNPLFAFEAFRWDCHLKKGKSTRAFAYIINEYIIMMKYNKIIVCEWNIDGISNVI